MEPHYSRNESKGKRALECEMKSCIYSKLKIEVEATFRGIDSSADFYSWCLNKVHTEFEIVALFHNLLKVIGIRQVLTRKISEKIKQLEKTTRFLQLFYFRDLLDISSLIFKNVVDIIVIQEIIDWRNQMTSIFLETQNSYYEYIYQVSNGCQYIADVIRKGDFPAAISNIIDLSEGLMWLMEVEKLMKENNYNIESATKMATDYLAEVNEALMRDDYVSVADLFEYEIKPIFGSTETWRFKKVVD